MAAASITNALYPSWQEEVRFGKPMKDFNDLKELTISQRAQPVPTRLEGSDKDLNGEHYSKSPPADVFIGVAYHTHSQPHSYANAKSLQNTDIQVNEKVDK